MHYINTYYIIFDSWLQINIWFVHFFSFFSQVWSVGEFCSSVLDSNCTAKIISKYYEVLETLLYEWSSITMTSGPDQEFPPRLLSILMSASAKVTGNSSKLFTSYLLVSSTISWNIWSATQKLGKSEQCIKKKLNVKQVGNEKVSA